MCEYEQGKELRIVSALYLLLGLLLGFVLSPASLSAAEGDIWNFTPTTSNYIIDLYRGGNGIVADTSGVLGSVKFYASVTSANSSQSVAFVLEEFSNQGGADPDPMACSTELQTLGSWGTPVNDYAGGDLVELEFSGEECDIVEGHFYGVHAYVDGTTPSGTITFQLYGDSSIGGTGPDMIYAVWSTATSEDLVIPSACLLPPWHWPDQSCLWDVYPPSSIMTPLGGTYVYNPTDIYLEEVFEDDIEVDVEIWFNDSEYPEFTQYCVSLQLNTAYPHGTGSTFLPICEDIISSGFINDTFLFEDMPYGTYNLRVFLYNPETEAQKILGTRQFVNMYSFPANQTPFPPELFGEYFTGTTSSSTTFLSGGLAIENCALYDDVVSRSICALSNLIRTIINWVFVPPPNAFSDLVTTIREYVLRRAPIGYIYRFYEIFSNEAVGEFPTISLTFKEGAPLGGETIAFDFDDTLDQASALLTGITASDGIIEVEEGDWDIWDTTNYVLLVLIYLSVLFAIIVDIMRFGVDNRKTL